MKTCMFALGLAGVAFGQVQFEDATEAVGLGGLTATRVVLVDLDGDTRPDVVVDRSRVFMNREAEGTPDEGGPLIRFIEVLDTGLPSVNAGDCLVFADIDNDGKRDAIVTRNVTADTEPVLPTAWYPGRGDGTFGAAVVIGEARPKTAACVAVGDVNGDGLLDLYLGNWYTEYGKSVDAFANDLLVQQADGSFERWETDEDRHGFSEDEDKGGRPTYGALIVRLGPDRGKGRGMAEILELSYGRRANRLWALEASGELSFRDLAPALGLEGDPIRHGRYPEWLKERAKTDARFDREDEKPYRSHGNTFDAAVGDVDGDGLFDVLLTTIAHGWAGESSDRSRLLMGRAGAEGGLAAFEPSAVLNLDRVPADPAVHNWNQGDLFCELADFDLDGRLDVLLSSGDYPDEQRLRVWRQMEDGSFVDATSWSGLDNDGSQQISLGDVDLDGDVDVVVGQSFNRMGAAQRAGRTPTLKVYLNRAIERKTGNGLVLLLEGDPEGGVTRDALGAIVRAEADMDGDGEPEAMLRQLVGIGGHAGKQHAFEVAFGMGGASRSERVTVWWPGAGEPTVIEGLAAGRHVIRRGE